MQRHHMYSIISNQFKAIDFVTVVTHPGETFHRLEQYEPIVFGTEISYPARM